MVKPQRVTSKDDGLPPGFHPGLSTERYLAIRAISNSGLGLLKLAPAKLWALMNHPEQAAKPETDSTFLGDAIHAAVLEPDLFKKKYVQAGTCTAELRSGDRKGQPCGAPGKFHGPAEGWRCGKHKPQTWSPGLALDAEEWACCMGIRDNVHSKAAQFHNPRARKLLGMADSDVELTGLWLDPITGERAKLRADHLSDKVATSTDIKSTLDASPIGFPSTFFSRRYYAQQAHYGMGYDELKRPMRHHYIIATEKSFPYLVAVYRIVDDVMRLGRAEIRQLLDLYHKCNQAGEWPGYPLITMDIGLPTWGEKQLRAALQMEV